MAASPALTAEQPQALSAKPERHVSANPSLRHLVPAGFISQRQEPVIHLFYAALSEEEPRAVSGRRGIALPAACRSSHHKPHAFRRYQSRQHRFLFL